MKIIKNIRNNATAAAMIGTALEYYDLSLYGFMAPILIKIFLPGIDTVNALILTFIFPMIALFIRPIGALVIGKIGDRHGRKTALMLSITGMAIVTGLIGMLPTYNTIGIFAPIIFVILRSLQGFFVAGEHNGGAIFILEHSKNKNKSGYLSGLYTMYTVVGIAAAAVVSTLTAYLPIEYWRIPYLLGFITGLFGLYIRNNIKESPQFLESQRKNEAPISELSNISSKIPSIASTIGVVGLFSCLYTLPTVFMNSFLPLVTSYNVSTIMLMNTFTTILYLFTFPLFGILADRISYYKSMIIAAIIILISSYPLISLISTNNLLCLLFMKLCFACLAAWFGAPFHAWAQNLFHVKNRYSFISLSYTIGSQLSGLMVPFSLWYWRENKSFAAIYGALMFWALMAIISLYYIRYGRTKRYS